MSDLNFSDTEAIAIQCEKMIEKGLLQGRVLCHSQFWIFPPHSRYSPTAHLTFISLKNVHFSQRKFQKHTGLTQQSKCIKHIGCLLICFKTPKCWVHAKKWIYWPMHNEQHNHQLFLEMDEINMPALSYWPQLIDNVCGFFASQWNLDLSLVGCTSNNSPPHHLAARKN